MGKTANIIFSVLHRNGAKYEKEQQLYTFTT